MLFSPTMLPPPSLERSHLKVTIFSRPDCHLCDVISRMAHAIQQEFPFDIEKVSVQESQALVERYGDRVPVVMIEGIEYCSGKITEGDLRRAIKKA
ncbi:glutaredoxin family protein, partial [Petrachloros mirabilis]